ncbi:response regulator transcription factor [Salicibibacter cibarius]|uniref:Response regulator transcription factor n=1 Tax=Salicibibacter cibarius TaxID=2743000 RepID=A0A7T7CD65_9BACI|nr:response regulator transcription factor [Salicibibacter cibarius]QQK77672.1 response regulator transcription factor [Salicibibacter cibarius]
MSAKILVVEDDYETNQLLCKYLRKEMFQVFPAYTGEEAFQKLSTYSFELVVLDLMLPGIDGFEILRKIRSEKNTPVIILSAKDESQDKVVGLNLGSDDYITKPFNMSEVIARVKAQLRRFTQYNLSGNDQTDHYLTYGDMTLDLNAYVVEIGDDTTSLREKECQILKLLMSNPKKVFTKEYLFENIWGESYLNTDENKIMVHIRRLREKIEPDPSNPKYIQTVWGIGYKLGDEDIT